MKTLIDRLKEGEVPPSLINLARKEGIDSALLIERIISGEAVVLRNRLRGNLDPLGIGKGLRTKVNANIGTSEPRACVEDELMKLRTAVEAKADAVMDLSTGGDIDLVRRKILDGSAVPVGTVPIYQAAAKAKERGSIVEMTAEDLFEAIEVQAMDGVDFMTVHVGINAESLEALRRTRRVTGVVSRGGALTIGWMIHNERENPLCEHFDRLLEIARRYEVTLSLGDGMRPGCLADASDEAQIQELLVLGKLVREARERGVQVMVEGPGHMPIDQIEANVLLEKKVCAGAPFYVLGPLVTDIAPGYDHITAAIGGAIAGAAGADFLCYVTPSEHLGLPSALEVKEGVIASRIAAHAADIVKGIKRAMDWDVEMAKARKALDWERQAALAIDPPKVEAVRTASTEVGETCTMCGDFCAMKIASDFLGDGDVQRC